MGERRRHPHLNPLPAARRLAGRGDRPLERGPSILYHEAFWFFPSPRGGCRLMDIRKAMAFPRELRQAAHTHFSVSAGLHDPSSSLLTSLQTTLDTPKGSEEPLPEAPNAQKPAPPPPSVAYTPSPLACRESRALTLRLGGADRCTIVGHPRAPVHIQEEIVEPDDPRMPGLQNSLAERRVFPQKIIAIGGDEVLPRDDAGFLGGWRGISAYLKGLVFRDIT